MGSLTSIAAQCAPDGSIDLVGQGENLLSGDRAAGAGGKADEGGVGTHSARDINGLRHCEAGVGHGVGQSERQGGAIVGQMGMHGVTAVQIHS